jgi:hypothetical protein
MTFPHWLRRAAPALAVATFWLWGCSPTRFQVDHRAVAASILEEDSAIHATCVRLHSEGLGRLDPTARDAFLWDVELGLARFFEQFEIESKVPFQQRACQPRPIAERALGTQGTFPPACHEKVAATLGRIDADRTDRTLQMRQLLDSYRQLLTAARLCETPCDVAAVLSERTALVVRLVDLSPAAVSRLVFLGNALDDVASRTAESIPVVPSGHSKLALRTLAAEIVASVTDSVLRELETSRLISEASVARNACQLYNSGTALSDVTSAILKRAILRFDPASRNTYAPLRYCQGNPAACKQARELVGVRRAELVPRLLTAGAQRDTTRLRPQLANQARRVREATGVCAGRTACPIPVINRVASILVVAGEAGDSLQVDQARDYLGRMESLLGEASGRIREVHEALPRVDYRLSQVERSVTRLASLSDIEVNANSYLRVKLIELLGELRKCRTEIDSARRAREKLLQRLTGQKLGCGGGWESAAVPLPDGRSSATLHRKQVCTLGIPIELAFTADTLFERCYGKRMEDPGQVMPRLAKWLEEVRPARVIVEAHTDARPPSDKPRQDGRSCREVYPNNQRLADARAATAAQSLAAAMTDKTIEITPFGRGDSEARKAAARQPARRLCGDDDDDCHAQFRRLVIRIWGGAADVDLACMN